MTATGRLTIEPTFDYDEIRHLLECGRSARSVAAVHGMSVASLERKAERAGHLRLALLIRTEVLE